MACLGFELDSRLEIWESQYVFIICCSERSKSKDVIIVQVWWSGFQIFWSCLYEDICPLPFLFFWVSENSSSFDSQWSEWACAGVAAESSWQLSFSREGLQWILFLEEGDLLEQMSFCQFQSILVSRIGKRQSERSEIKWNTKLDSIQQISWEASSMHLPCIWELFVAPGNLGEPGNLFVTMKAWKCPKCPRDAESPSAPKLFWAMSAMAVLTSLFLHISFKSSVSKSNLIAQSRWI